MKMQKRSMVAVTLALSGLVALGGVALATAPSGMISTTIATGSLDPLNINVRTGDWNAKLRTQGQTTVQVVENHVGPNGTFGWHSHPGPSLIVVKSGTITFYHADDPSCSPDVRHAGDALVDAGTDVHIGRNEGTQDAVVIVTRLLPAGAAPRVDEPASSFCSF